MIGTTLKSTGLPCVYSHFAKPKKPPYLAYIGDGQNTLKADDTIYWRENTYRVEYYFTEKNEANEKAIKDFLFAEE